MLNPYEFSRINFEIRTDLKRYFFKSIGDALAGSVFNRRANHGNAAISQKKSFDSADTIAAIT